MTIPVSPDFDPSDESLEEDLSKAFHLLRAKRRRQVVWCMAYLDSNASVTVREIAKQIASVEQGVPARAVNNDDYRTVYTNLDQHHLSKLDDAGVIEYNPDRQIVSPGPNTMAFVTVTGISIPAFHLLLTKKFE